MRTQKKLMPAIFFLLSAFSLFHWAHIASAHDDTLSKAITLFPSQADYFTHLAESADPRTALVELRTQSRTDATVAENCHDLAHLVGHGAFKKYHDFATTFSYYNEVCNSGYIHGAIEEYLGATDDPLATLATVCTAYPPKTFLGWQCYHGVGHGLMFYTTYDLPESLALCKKYTDADARASCTNGVFMENFNADGDRHKSTFVKNDDLFYPCGEMADDLKNDCYIYAPVHYLNTHPEQYKRALKWCRAAPIGYQITCTIGLGSQLEKEHLLDPARVDRECARGSLWQITPCVRGAATLAVYNDGTTADGYALCDAMSFVRSGICQRTVRALAGIFQ